MAGWSSEGWSLPAIIGGGGGGGSPPTVTADAKTVFPPDNTYEPLNIGAGELVVVVIAGYGFGTTTTASSPNLGSFTSAGGTASGGQVLWAVNTTGGPLTGEVITHGPQGLTGHAYSISGANNSSPIDDIMIIPHTGSPQSLDVSVTTTHANDLLIANSFGTVDTGWTAAPATAYGDTNEYKTVTATGTYHAFAGQSLDSSSLIVAIKGA